MSSGRASDASNDQELDVLEFIALDSDLEGPDHGDANWTPRRLRTPRSQRTFEQRMQAVIVLVALAALIAVVVAALIWQEDRPPPTQLTSTQAQWEVLPFSPGRAAEHAAPTSHASLAAAKVAEAAAASWDLDARPQRCGKGTRDVSAPSDEVIKSASDPRDHRSVELPGGLIALLTSDATADFAAAAMDVGAGSINDPQEFQGLAHFLEHMLFMGSKKYPEEDGYSKFIAENGGSDNAYTDEEHTNFFVKVPASVLPQALDRFAQFFAEPLLRAGSAAREVRAVDAEHHKNLNDDAWRLHQLELSSCSGRVNHFGTGDTETLRGGSAETVAALHAFHKKYYVAPNLRLSVLGAEPLDKLEEIVRKAFAGVRRGVAPPKGADKSAKLCPNSRVYVIEPVGDLQDLMLTWPTRELTSARAQRTGLAALLSHMLASKHEGSLYADLKRRGWATQVSFGVDMALADLAVLSLSVSLTKDGLKAVPEVVDVALGHVRLVVETMEKYVRAQRENHDETGKGLCSLWSDALAIGDLNFHFQEKADEASFVTRVASDLHDLPPRDVLGATDAFRLDTEVIQSVAESLNPREKLPNLYVVANGFDGGEDLRPALAKHTEPIYGTRYLSGQIPDTLSARWHAVKVPTFAALPWNSIRLVPKRLELQPKPKGDLAKRSTAPKRLIVSRPDRTYTVYYKPDADYRSPQVSLRCLAATPASGLESAAAMIESGMLAAVLVDGLEVPLNDAAKAGYSCSVSASDSGLLLEVSGYSGSALEIVAHRLAAALLDPPRLAPGRFEALLEAKRRSIRSERNAPLYQVIAGKMKSLAIHTQERSWDEMLQALDKVTWDTMLDRAKAIRSAAALTCFAHGDISSDMATKLTSGLADAMVVRTIPITSVPLPGLVVLPRKEELTEFRTSSFVAGDENAAVILNYQLDPPRLAKDELQQAAAMLLLQSLGNQRAFDLLRTKESLGYVVQLWASPELVEEAPDSSLWCMNLIVQSGVKSATFIRDRMARFLDALLVAFDGDAPEKSLRRLTEPEIAPISAADLQMAKEGLITGLLKRPDTLAGEGGRIWHEISIRRFSFARPWDVAEVVKGITRKDIARVLRTLLNPGKSARKAAIEVWSSRDGDALKASAAVPLSDIKKLRRWKAEAGNWSSLLSSETVPDKND